MDKFVHKNLRKFGFIAASSRRRVCLSIRDLWWICNHQHFVEAAVNEIFDENNMLMREEVGDNPQSTSVLSVRTVDITQKWQYKDVKRKPIENQHHISILEAHYILSVQ